MPTSNFFFFWITTGALLLLWIYIASSFGKDVFFNLYVNRARTLLFRPVTWVQSIAPRCADWAAAALLFGFVLLLRAALAKASGKPLFHVVGNRGLEHLDRRRLRRGVGRGSRQPAKTRDAGDAGERPATRCAHRRDERMEGVEEPRNVGVEHRAERREVLLVLDHRAARHAGVRDHDVRHAVPREEVSAGGDHRGGVAHVGGVGLDDGRSDRALHAFEFIGAPRHETEHRAMRAVVPHQRLAEAGRRAGDEDPERGVRTHAGARGPDARAAVAGRRPAARFRVSPWGARPAPPRSLRRSSPARSDARPRCRR